MICRLKGVALQPHILLGKIELQPFFTTDINCCWPAVSNKLEDLKRHDQKLTIFSPYLDWVRDNPTSFLDLAKNCDAVHYNKI